MGKVNASEQKVTFIENLPDLEDINGLTSDQYKLVNRKIREKFQPPHGSSGMNMNSDVNYSSRNRQHLIVNTSQENNNLNSSTIEESAQNIIYNQPQSQLHSQAVQLLSQAVQAQSQEGFKHFNMPICSPSCLDVAEHISKCPICSKFYNTDKTIYIIAIITLVIICILLLKKVLDV